MTTIINAFHPSYVATYMPEFMTKICTESAQAQNGRMYGYGARSKVQRESGAGASVNTITHFQKTKYSKAGTANTTKKKKK